MIKEKGKQVRNTERRRGEINGSESEEAICQKERREKQKSIEKRDAKNKSKQEREIRRGNRIRGWKGGRNERMNKIRKGRRTKEKGRK